jgi:hypothetical protein
VTIHEEAKDAEMLNNILNHDKQSWWGDFLAIHSFYTLLDSICVELL